jgi:MFS family permease
MLICTGFSIGTVGPLRDMMIRGVASASTMGRVYGVIYSGIDVGAALGPVIVGRCLDRHRADLALSALAATLGLAALISTIVVRQLRAHGVYSG